MPFFSFWPCNIFFTAAAGAGLDLIQAWLGEHPQRLTLKYDFFFLDAADDTPAYFSPDEFQVHTPSLDWRWLPGGNQGLIVGLEAGIPLQPGEDPGWIAGGFARIPLGKRVRFETDRVEYAGATCEFSLTLGK